MRRIKIFLIMTIICATSFAQNIEFYSTAFEMAVKNQLGLDEKSSVDIKMSETITVLDMSGYDIEDIRDMIYFQNLENLDISYNKIEDISPLIPLNQLKFLDVSGNRLKSIDALSFSESSEMTVNLSGNYITEYALIFNNPYCLFTIIGLNNQKTSYIINRFYTDFDLKTSQKIINYNVWTYSVYDSLFLMFDGKKELITDIEDDVQKRNITANVAYLNFENQNVDTVYFVLPQDLEVNEKTTVFTPSIPGNYNILSAEASKTSVTFSDKTVSYTVVENIATDTVKIGFGKNNYDIRGYTYYFINSGDLTDIEKVAESDKLLYYPNPVDNTLTVHIPNPNHEKLIISLVSLTGQIVYQVETIDDIHHINVMHLGKGIYILHVKAGDENFIEKIIKR